MRRWFNYCTLPTIRTKNKIFSYYLLSTWHEENGKSLKHYQKKLRILSIVCNFRSMNAEKEQIEGIMDSYINKLQNAQVRQSFSEQNSWLENSLYIDLYIQNCFNLLFNIADDALFTSVFALPSYSEFTRLLFCKFSSEIFFCWKCCRFYKSLLVSHK